MPPRHSAPNTEQLEKYIIQTNSLLSIHWIAPTLIAPRGEVSSL
jgi:hypothetical protein